MAGNRSGFRVKPRQPPTTILAGHFQLPGARMRPKAIACHCNRLRTIDCNGWQLFSLYMQRNNFLISERTPTQSECTHSHSYLLRCRQSIMTECQCMHIVITDPTFVVCTCHERLGLLHCANCESLVIDAFECTVNCCILLPASNTRLYNSMFFTLVLLPSVMTLRGTPLAALCTTSFSSIRQYILGRSPTNSVIR